MKINRPSFVLVFALALSLLSSALSLAKTPATPSQQGTAGQSMKGAVLKGRAPVSKELLKVKLPKAKEATLNNGLRVIVLEGYDKVPTFTMQMVILSGGLSDPPHHHRLAGFPATLLRESTASKP